ncbi:tyrosine--tRNA ligase [Clostridium sp. CAG:914]|nr:tyrosine--tRNA ligase [Clostridium sp. CAG:914]
MNKEEQINVIIRKAVQIFNEDTLREKLKSNKKLVVKFGADPSRPNLHLGHTVPLRVLKTLQDMGHEIVFVIGDFTAMIGDPSGKSKTRPQLTFEETRKSGETYFKQVTKILDKEKTKIVYNSEWLEKMNFKDVLELTGKYTVARLLERDDFSNRFNNKTPIGVHEFMYPLMQGYDSVAIKADIEIGGTDQTFNLLVGRELQRDYGQTRQDVIVFPLLVGLDGKEKMSKSLDNYIGIDEEPAIMFEKAMRIPDECLENYFKLTTDISSNIYKDWINEDIFNAHKEYAKEIIRMYHGKEFIEQAVSKYETKASKSITDDIDTITISNNLPITLIDLLLELNLVASKSEARRLIEQNGISINQIKENDVNRIIDASDFKNGFIVIQKGKKVFLKVELEA